MEGHYFYPWSIRSVLFRSKQSGLTLRYSSVWYPFDSVAEGSELRLIRHDQTRAIAFSVIFLGDGFEVGMNPDELAAQYVEGIREEASAAEIVQLDVGKLFLDRQAVAWVDIEIKYSPLLANKLRIFTLQRADKVWCVRFSTPRDEILFRRYLPSAEEMIRSISFPEASEGQRQRAEKQTTPPDELVRLTDGMIIGRALDDEIFDIAFPGDMIPDVDFIAAAGKSAQLVCAIRIAKNEPILMLKVVHFSQGSPLGVSQITATSGTDMTPAVHRFPKAMVSRQSVSSGTIEFATCVPFVEPSAGKVLAVIRNSPACNLEVKGTDGFTTFSPGRTARLHANSMITLYEVLQKRPSLVARLQQDALSYKAFQQALMKGQ